MCLQLKIYYVSMDREIKQFGNSMFLSFQENDISHEEHHQIHDNSLLKSVEPTSENPQFVSVTDFLHSSSLQIGHRDYTISFQEGFMDEHQKAIRKQIENFIESSFKQDNIKNITFQSEEVFREDLQFGSFKNPEDFHLTFEHKNKFIHNSKQEESLEQVLSLFFELFPKKVASEMLFVCSFANLEWETRLNSYRDFSNQLQIVRESKKLAQKMYDQLYKDERIRLLNLSVVNKSELNEQETLKKAFKFLIQFLFATVGLVSSGFFNNPYSESDEFKRSRSYGLEEDDEQYSSSSTGNQLGLIGQPKKRIH